MNQIEQYFQQLAQSFSAMDYWSFAGNFLILAILAGVLSVFFTRFGLTPGNRRRFSLNFVPLALATMVIIFIVKSSVALSLGLVGALSIVRFRAAIKEPEELIYLFITIGLGLAAGAGQIVVALGAFPFLLAVLFIQSRFRAGSGQVPKGKMLLNLSSGPMKLEEVVNLLKVTFPYVELRRIEEGPARFEASFAIEAKDAAQISEALDKLRLSAPQIQISIIEPSPLQV